MNDSRLRPALRLGLLVNPWAGIGGPAGLRGSDGAAIRESALARGVLPMAGERAVRFLMAMKPCAEHIELLVWGGAMGADAALRAGMPARVVGEPGHEPSLASDTVMAAGALADAGCDLLLFVGGDGTARDVCAAIGRRVLALGIPAGVKMYSGVFAVSPEAAAEIVGRLLAGQAVTLDDADVRDIDEEAFRADRVLSRHYGELQVPGVRGYLQQVKCGGRQSELIEQQEIAAGVVETLLPAVLYLAGSGTTIKAVMDGLGLANSLLGIDAIRDGALVAADLDADGIRALLDRNPDVRLLITPTGGQGFLLGRGNQQLAADIVRRIGIDRFVILATRAKLDELAGRPLLVDTGDLALDTRLAGLRPVVTGYAERVLYRVAPAFAPVPEA